MQEKISVIVPIYNVEKYLNRCVNSIINQTYTNLEIILVDDGSPDNCPNLCDDWAKKDSRIKVIHKENGGLSDARNAGLNVCTGDYVTFVDSDDFVSEIIIESLFKNLKKYNAEISICCSQVFKEDDDIVLDNDYKIFEILKETAIENTYKTTNREFLTAWGKLYKRELFAELRYKKGFLHEDEFIIHHLYHLSKKIVVTTQKLYYYFKNENSITGGGFKLKRIDILRALQDRSEFLKQNYLELYKESFATFFVYRCIDIFFEIPNDFKEKKLAQKLTKQYFNLAYKGLKGIKSPSKKRFLIFKICPSLYRRLFR